MVSFVANSFHPRFFSDKGFKVFRDFKDFKVIKVFKDFDEK